jgi:hypothetical protein
MRDFIFEKAKELDLPLELPSLLQGMHWAARAVFKGLGFQWEIHRNGDQKVGYWKIHFRNKSKGKPYPKRFILLPGFGDTPLSWQAQVLLLQPVLRQEFDELILVDLPGFGGFLSHERSFVNFDLMMTAMGDVLDYLKPHTVLGHSLGGWLASSYASLCGQAKRPLANRLNYSGPESIILVNPSGIYNDQRVKLELESVFRSAVKGGFLNLKPNLFLREPFWFQYIEKHFERLFQRDDIAQLIDSAKTEHDLTLAAQHIRSDVWVVWGENDTLIPSTCLESWLTSLNPEFRDRHHAVLLRAVGHCPQLEAPWVTSAVVGQILKNRIPSRLGGKWWNVLQ